MRQLRGDNGAFKAAFDALNNMAPVHSEKGEESSTGQDLSSIK